MNNLVEIKNNEITISGEFVEKYKEFKKLQATMDLMEKQVKEELKEAMKGLDKSTYIENGIAVTYKKATTRTNFDTKRLKEENPDVYDLYTYTSDVSDSISIKCDI